MRGRRSSRPRQDSITWACGSPRADLEAWQAHLEAQGVAIASPANRPLTQNPIYDRPYGSVLVFRDPDNIQLEMVSPPSA
jgi:glyoxylase I family protein